MNWNRDRWFCVACALVSTLIVLGQAANAGQDENQRKRDWQTRYESVLHKAAAAEARIAEARLQISKLRHRDRYRGKQRADVESRLHAAEQELTAAKQAIAVFPDAARHAGIPPGWLREVEEKQAREG